MLLREYNRQRDKLLAEKLREEIVSANPVESYRALTEYREEKAKVGVAGIDIRGLKRRAEISPAKKPFLDAVLNVIEGRRDFWPLSDRSIHYALLNAPPLKHASKPDSRYDNTPQSYKSLIDLLTRARLDGSIPWKAIADITRPVTNWDVYSNPHAFVRKQLGRFLKGYYRNLMQSQAIHIEIVGEKNTIENILRPVAGEYTIPLTTGRGYYSLPPRYEMYQRYRRSGKDKLLLLFVTDFDPDGEEIAHSFARSIRDDFNVYDVEAVILGSLPEHKRLLPLTRAQGRPAPSNAAWHSFRVLPHARRTARVLSAAVQNLGFPAGGPGRARQERLACRRRATDRETYQWPGGEPKLSGFGRSAENASGDWQRRGPQHACSVTDAIWRMGRGWLRTACQMRKLEKDSDGLKFGQ